MAATPSGVYRAGAVRVFVTALPFGLVANVPACLLLGRPLGGAPATIAAAAGAWLLLAQGAWWLAIRRYRGGNA